MLSQFRHELRARFCLKLQKKRQCLEIQASDREESRLILPSAAAYTSVLVTFLLLWLNTMIKELSEGKFYFSLQFQKNESPSWPGGMEASVRRCSRTRELKYRIFRCKCKAVQVTWGLVISRPVPGDILPPTWLLFLNLLKHLPSIGQGPAQT